MPSRERRLHLEKRDPLGDVVILSVAVGVSFVTFFSICVYILFVSMTRKYNNRKHQTNLRYHEEETQNIATTSVTTHLKQSNHARIQKVLSEGVQIDYVFFLVDGEIEDPNTALTGPTSKTPLKWRFAGGQMMAQH